MPCSSARRAIYVDSREQAREEAGDLIEPAARGRVRWEDVHELQDVVAGTVNGRVGEDDVLLFKSSGCRLGPRGRCARGRARARAEASDACRRARDADVGVGLAVVVGLGELRVLSHDCASFARP